MSTQDITTNMVLKGSELRELKKKAKSLDILLRIGKSGITPSVVLEVKRQLQKNKMIKVRYLKSFIGGLEKKAVNERLTKLTDSFIVASIGSVVTLHRITAKK